MILRIPGNEVIPVLLLGLRWLFQHLLANVYVSICDSSMPGGF
jgi:hypothetical protein